jgi:hypothetical protein
MKFIVTMGELKWLIPAKSTPEINTATNATRKSIFRTIPSLALTDRISAAAALQPGGSGGSAYMRF